MLLHAARIVNSTPLFDPPESPNDAEPITPHQLITQKDEGSYSRPTIHSAEDLMAYGTNRWKKTEALTNEFWMYWKQYMYSIGTERGKYTMP